MIRQFDESHSTLKGKFVNLPPKGVLGDPQEQQPIFAGWGACRSCGCTGYIQGGAGYQNCKACGHHFSQHK